METDRVNRRWTAADGADAPQRKRRGVLAGTLLAIATLAGAAWYAYPSLQHYRATINEVPTVRQTVNTVGEKVAGLESKWNTWLDENKDYQDRLKKMELRFGSALRNAESQAREMTDQVYSRIQREIEQRDEALHTRLAQLESQSNTEHLKLAAMQDEISQLRADTSRQSTQLASMEQTTQRNFDDVKQTLNGVDERLRASDDRVHNGAREFHAFSDGLRMDRIRFEASRNRDTEVAPGLTLYVTGTDIAKRTVNGWIWVLPDRKTVWLHGQNAMQPAIFYSNVDGKRREVVFTSVTTSGAVGYVLVPAKPGDSPAPTESE